MNDVAPAEGRSLTPQPDLFPYCTSCERPYVLRRAWLSGGPPRWLWVHDCVTPAGNPKRVGHGLSVVEMREDDGTWHGTRSSRWEWVEA